MMIEINFPIVSIIIPCFNCESLIDRAIASVFAQRSIDWELILVNNNSTDNTFHVLNNYQSRYPEKILVLDEPKRGAPSARNKGLRVAKGEWIQFLDADDELLTDKISQQIDIAQSENAFFVAGNSIIVSVVNGQEHRRERGLIIDDLWIALAKSQLGITSANLYNKEALLSIGGWDEQLSSSQEYDLIFRLFKNDFRNISFDTDCNTLIHKSDSSISFSPDLKKKEEIIEQRVRLRIKIKNFLQENQLLTKDRLTAIDEYIYYELFRNRLTMPGYVYKRIADLQMNIPYSVRIRDFFSGKKKTLLNIFSKH